MGRSDPVWGAGWSACCHRIEEALDLARRKIEDTKNDIWPIGERPSGPNSAQRACSSGSRGGPTSENGFVEVAPLSRRHPRTRAAGAVQLSPCGGGRPKRKPLRVGV